MKIEWINHASFILNTEEIKLISDPWIEGRVFNESWEHLSKTEFDYSQFEKITHIWFSHEHPDHFFPPNINKIPPKTREKITVLFQETIDKKVIHFCKKSGFKEVIELPLNSWYQLNREFKIICNKVDNETDSWLGIKHKNNTILNLNDCAINTLQELEQIQQTLGSIDVLLTQFSYANWIGNKKDVELKRQNAIKKQKELIYQIQVLKPTYTIPFASFVWFCSEHNFHMNEHANSIDEIDAAITSVGSKSVVLYPGDDWQIGEIHNSQLAIKRYLEDKNLISNRPLTKYPKISLPDLILASKNYRSRALKENNKLKLFTYKPMRIFLTDYQASFEFSFKLGLIEQKKLTEDTCDISFCSQNLKYCFDFKWGFDTIFVAGTFEKPAKGNFNNVLEYQWINNLNNKGKRMNGLFFRVINRLFQKKK